MTAIPQSALCFLLPALFAIGCGITSGDSENGEDKENDPVLTEGPGYPDDYRPWAGYENRQRWGPYNLHDPSCMDDGEWTWCYSTDAAYGGINRVGIQVRRSKNLVDWEFAGWAFSGIPDEAFEYVTEQNNEEPGNIWAPFIMKTGNTYRLYYSVSVFGSSASYIGLATSTSPDGEWEQQGKVLATTHADTVNAIDPSVIADQTTGEHWMAYGSWSSGIYMVQLDPATGKLLEENDQGKRIAQRDGDVLEAPEVIYHEPSGMYYLFVSYGELFDVYNVRVGRSENPTGPYLDFNGEEMDRKSDNYPLLTAPYRFANHSGWQGLGHTGVFRNGDEYYMMHQGRPKVDPHLMVMHLRKLWWTPDGWPVASPQRFGNIEQHEISSDSIPGHWEHILLESFGDANMVSQTEEIVLFSDGSVITENENGTWTTEDNLLVLRLNGETVELYLSYGYDWENKKAALLYMGLNSEGRSIWGKKTGDSNE